MKFDISRLSAVDRAVESVRAATCPCRDGSLLHPCPAHPQTNKGRA